MRLGLQLAFLLVCLVGQTYTAPSVACEENGWALCDYVHRDDGYYNYEVYDVIQEDDVTSYYINMTSQKWKDETWTNQPVWWHHFVIHVPDTILYPENGFIYVSGRSNNNSPPDQGTGHNRMTRLMAQAGGFITSVLFNIPNQPLIFTDDDRQAERWEDNLIAWTWREYLNQYEADPDNQADPEVVLRMPMVKGVIRAMDTVQDFLFTEHGVNVEGFMLAGESKRGWTTWMTAPVDDRVVAMAPVVLSSLKLNENFHHYYQSFGGWPLYFWDYWNKGIMGRIDDEATVGPAGLESIVDPYSYRAGMTMPTLIVSSTSDEFFLIDDTHYFFEDLPTGPRDKFFWLLENSGHSISSSPRNADYWKMLETFYISVITGFERPEMSWTLDAPEEREGTGSIQFISDVAPAEIMAFSAPSVVEDRRDWRKSVRCDPIADLCGEKNTNITWTKTDVELQEDGSFFVEYDVPETGFLAFYMQVRYEGPDGRDMWFSSEANIIPDYFPWDDCSGQNCTGILK